MIDQERKFEKQFLDAIKENNMDTFNKILDKVLKLNKHYYEKEIDWKYSLDFHKAYELAVEKQFTEIQQALMDRAIQEYNSYEGMLKAREEGKDRSYEAKCLSVWSHEIPKFLIENGSPFEYIKTCIDKINIYDYKSKVSNEDRDYFFSFGLDCALKSGRQDVIDLFFEKIEKFGMSFDWHSVKVASDMGNIDAVRRLLSKELSHNIGGASERTALQCAAEHGYTEIAKLLLDFNYEDVNGAYYEGNEPLVLAIKNGHFDTAKLLFENGAILSSGVYGEILEKPDTLKALHDYYLSDNVSPYLVKTIVPLAIQYNQTDFIKNLIKSQKEFDKQEALCYAARTNKQEIVKLLLENGARVNPVSSDWVNKSPLNHAIASRNLDMVKLLVNCGAKVNTMGYDCRNETRITPLMQELLICAKEKKSDSKIFDFLVEKGAKFGGRGQDNEEVSPFEMLARKDNGSFILPRTFTALKMLFNHGEKPLQDDDLFDQFVFYGNTGVRLGADEMAKFLIENGMDVNAKDKNGSTNLMKAITIYVDGLLWDHRDFDRESTEKLIDLLFEKGADVKAQVEDKLVDGKVRKDSVLTKVFRDFWTKISEDDFRYGVKSELTNLVTDLVKRGADLNVQNEEGMTPLMYLAKIDKKYATKYATKYLFTDFAKFLIENGADVNVKDKDGKSVFDYASKKTGMKGTLENADKIIKWANKKSVKKEKENSKE